MRLFWLDSLRNAVLVLSDDTSYMAQHKVIALTATMPIFFIDVPIKLSKFLESMDKEKVIINS